MALVIQYNNKEIALEEGKSVVLLCTGKEMIENIKVFADNAVQTPTTSLNEYGVSSVIPEEYADINIYYNNQHLLGFNKKDNLELLCKGKLMKGSIIFRYQPNFTSNFETSDNQIFTTKDNMVYILKEE